MMNWAITETDKFDYFTPLKEVLRPILDDIGKLKWLITDVEYLAFSKDVLPVNLNDDHFILSAVEFDKLVTADVQFIWGVFLGIPQDVDLKVDIHDLPYADTNPNIWKRDNLQHPEAVIELVCFDSSCTILKFRDERLSEKFSDYFHEAIELQ
jgi:hypothetical protein